MTQVAPPQFAGQLGGARPQTKGFAAATAEVTGESKAQINRNLARAEAVGDDILKLSGTSQMQAVAHPYKTFVDPPASCNASNQGGRYPQYPRYPRYPHKKR